MQPVDRVKVFLVVTCSSEVNVEECWRAQVSKDWLSGSEPEWRGTSTKDTHTHRKRKGDKDTCTSLGRHQSSHTSHQLRVTTCRLCHFLPHSRNQPTVDTISGTRSLEGISQLLGGELQGFILSTNFLLTFRCQWIQHNDSTDMLVPSCTHQRPDSQGADGANLQVLPRGSVRGVKNQARPF